MQERLKQSRGNEEKAGKNYRVCPVISEIRPGARLRERNKIGGRYDQNIQPGSRGEKKKKEVIIATHKRVVLPERQRRSSTKSTRDDGDATMVQPH